MYCVKKVTEDLTWVGANDRRLSMFEGVYSVPNGVSYNSYLLLDEKTVLFDTVDKSVSEQFMENVEHVLSGRRLDYVVIQHGTRPFRNACGAFAPPSRNHCCLQQNDRGHDKAVFQPRHHAACTHC